MSPIHIPLSERTKRILASLLAVEGPRSVAQISTELGLTPAQVRYCLRYLEPWLGERGVTLQKTPRIGVSVDAPPAVRRSLLDETRRFGAAQLVLSREERLQLLVLRLLLAKSPLSLPALAREFGVSRSTLFRDLSVARKWLEQRRLRAHTRRGAGVQIQGSETCWRDAMVELLLSNLDAGTFIAACVLGESGPPAQAASHSAVLVRAREFLQSLDLDGADQMVFELESALKGALVDRAHMELVLHVALAVRRAQTGHGVDQPAAAHRRTATVADGRLPGVALQWLEQNFHRLPAAEREYVAGKVCQAISAGLVPKHGPGSPGDEASHSAGEAAGLLAKEAAKYLHARLFHDEELINCLALELSRADAESWPGASPAEPHSWSPKAPANALYGFTQRMLSPIIESYGYLPSEQLLSSIAMHLETALQRLGSSSVRRKVWVVCGSGVATARNLISRLNLHLPQLGVMGLASAFELARDPAMVRRADAIISTVPLGWVTGIQVLQVSPLLTEEDVTMLKSALYLDPPRAPMAQAASSASGLSLLELLTPRTVQQDAVANDWEEVVDCAGALLLAVGAVWPSYIEAMKDMIRLYGPYVVVAPGAALLHAGPEMGGKRLSMSLVTLRYPVPFGHTANDPVHVALAFSSIDHSTHVRAVGEAMVLLSNGDALDGLREAPTAEDMLRVIRDTTAVES